MYAPYIIILLITITKITIIRIIKTIVIMKIIVINNNMYIHKLDLAKT